MGSWWIPEIDGVVPGGRGGHASCVVDTMVLVFGGADRNLTVYDDVWVLEAGTGKLEWTLVQPKQPAGMKVAARVGATLTAVGNLVYLVGGQDPMSGLCFDEVLMLDTLVWEWSRLEIRGGSAPPRHSHCAGQFQHNCLLVFGGANPHGLLNDVWVLNLEQGIWISPTIGGYQPEAREMHVGVMMDSSTMVVHGGRGENGRVLGDFLVFDGDSMTWVQQQQTAFPRCSHSAALFTLPVATEAVSAPDGEHASAASVDKSVVLLFGGFSGEAVVDDLIVLDLESGQLESMDTFKNKGIHANLGEGPPTEAKAEARFAHTAVTLREVAGRQGQGMVVFGGVTASEDLRDVAIWCNDAFVTATADNPAS